MFRKVQEKKINNGRNCQAPDQQQNDQQQKKRERSSKRSQKKSKSKEEEAQEEKCKKSETLKDTPNKNKFPKYIPLKEIDDILKEQDPKNPEYIEEYLRINPKCYKHAYLSLPDERNDLLIIGLRDRNRAFEGDLVVARINPPEKWLEISGNQIQKTGAIVCIREKIHPRKAVGLLKETPIGIFIYPRDHRIPLVKIYAESLSKNYTTQLDIHKDKLFLVNIMRWAKPQFAVGKIVEEVGRKDDVQVESNAILLEHDLDVTPYSQEVTKGLPNSDYVLTEDDVKDREDWRQECIFTIDPLTAVDLDDAVSCKLLENGNYEIGVHVADVTHYLEFLSPLDRLVAKRATTVYMTDNVYHMLPQQLCQACSLLPGQDKLAFSVIWEMTPNTEIVKHRFVKTVIKSCCQMAYQHAQQFIENPQNDWSSDFLSTKGGFSVKDLSVKVNTLHKLATQLRDKRFANGALRIDQPKIHVIIDRNTNVPVSYIIEEQEDSNRLIEEFMLLANMTVASHLYQAIPETALLRNHKEPVQQVLSRTRDVLQKFGIHLDIDSAGSLHASIKRYEEGVEHECSEIKDIQKYRKMVINNLCSRAMARATYRCSSTIKTVEELRHYALNVSFYTHFTSPIRRYSDCVVHRLLYASMQDVALHEEWSKKLCMKIAKNCNTKKYNAKVAQKQSSELYFAYLTHLNGSTVKMAIVSEVKEKNIDVILCESGIKLRIYLTDIDNLQAVEYSSECSVPTITITWKQPTVTQMINVFTLLNVEIKKHPESFRLSGVILPPK